MKFVQPEITELLPRAATQRLCRRQLRALRDARRWFLYFCSFEKIRFRDAGAKRQKLYAKRPVLFRQRFGDGQHESFRRRVRCHERHGLKTRSEATLMIEPLFLARIGPRKRYGQLYSERTFKSIIFSSRSNSSLVKSPIEPKPAC